MPEYPQNGSRKRNYAGVDGMNLVEMYMKNLKYNTPKHENTLAGLLDTQTSCTTKDY